MMTVRFGGTFGFAARAGFAAGLASILVVPPAVARPPVADLGLPELAHLVGVPDERPDPPPPVRAIKDRYIVSLADSATTGQLAQARERARGRGGKIRHEFRHALKGFAATLPAAAVEVLRKDPRVLSVEPDLEVGASGVQVPTPSWGLDRVDQTGPPLNLTYSYNATGAGVTAYVIDSGIRASHADFGGRVGTGFTSIDDGNGTGDCNGHGTHVAGTIGGASYGVAKDVKLVPVRVLGCDGAGTTSGVIAGLDWVTANRSTPAVANMSLGAGASAALDAAVARTIAAGVPVVAAAGNSNLDACQSSPARAPGALTVGATTSSDARAEYSNFGTCLDLFAPGSGISSASNTADVASKVMSGTSMAAPHVAGVMATYLQNAPTALPELVSTAVLAAATLNGVTGAGAGSPSLLLHSVLPPINAPARTTPPVANRAPVAVAPTITLPDATTQIAASTAPLRVAWAGSDPDGDGIGAYQLQQSKDGGTTWTTVRLNAPTATTTTLALPSTAGLRLRVRATDGRGLTGAYATGPSTAFALRQQSAGVYSPSTSWANHSISGSYGGTVRRSRTTGSTAALTFTGTQMSLIATTAANRGRAEIFLDGVSQGVIDLYSATTRTRQVVFSRAIGAGTHKLQVKVLGTRNKAATATYVDIDGFITAD
jgi:subtilisin family serine protease